MDLNILKYEKNLNNVKYIFVDYRNSNINLEKIKTNLNNWQYIDTKI